MESRLSFLCQRFSLLLPRLCHDMSKNLGDESRILQSTLAAPPNAFFDRFVLSLHILDRKLFLAFFPRNKGHEAHALRECFRYPFIKRINFPAQHLKRHRLVEISKLFKLCSYKLAHAPRKGHSSG